MFHWWCPLGRAIQRLTMCSNALAQTTYEIQRGSFKQTRRYKNQPTQESSCIPSSNSIFRWIHVCEYNCTASKTVDMADRVRTNRAPAGNSTRGSRVGFTPGAAASAGMLSTCSRTSGDRMRKPLDKEGTAMPECWTSFAMLWMPQKESPSLATDTRHPDRSSCFSRGTNLQMSI